MIDVTSDKRDEIIMGSWGANTLTPLHKKIVKTVIIQISLPQAKC